MIYRNGQDNGRWSPNTEGSVDVMDLKDYITKKNLVIAIGIVFGFLLLAIAWGQITNSDDSGSGSGYALNEEQYLDKVMTLVGFDSESFALHYGYDICEQLDVQPASTVLMNLLSDGYNIPDPNKGSAVKAATTNLCMEHGAEVRRLVNQYGN